MLDAVMKELSTTPLAGLNALFGLLAIPAYFIGKLLSRRTTDRVGSTPSEITELDVPLPLMRVLSMQLMVTIPLGAIAAIFISLNAIVGILVLFLVGFIVNTATSYYQGRNLSDFIKSVTTVYEDEYENPEFYLGDSHEWESAKITIGIVIAAVNWALLMAMTGERLAKSTGIYEAGGTATANSDDGFLFILALVGTFFASFVIPLWNAVFFGYGVNLERMHSRAKK